MNFNNINHDGRAHALLSASGSERWMNCTASPKYSLEFPTPESSKYAEEGTRAHELAERILRGHPIHGSADAEMLKYVSEYTDYVLKRSLEKRLSIEESSNLTWLHPELKRGTADAVIRGDWEIEVIDLKYGAGTPVSPEENSQLMMYALMALWDQERQVIDQTYEKVIITVVQPRNGGINSWETTVDRMIAFAEELKEKAIEASSTSGKFRAGDHCKWCPCASRCAERLKVVHDVVAADFDVIPDPTKLTDKQILGVIRHKKTIESFLKDCEEFALGKLAAGQKMEGLKLVRGRGSRDWAYDAEKVEQKLLDVATPNDIYLSGLKSIAQIEKIVGKKVIEPLTVKKEGKITVAPVEDKRAAVETVSPDDFDCVENVNLLD